MATPDTIVIDREFAALCPPLDAEEYAQLEANLRTDGCRDPLIVWHEEGLLLDGHTRYAICQAHGLAWQKQTISLPSRDEALNWIITNQLGRRNLTAEQKSYLRGKRYNREKHTHGGARRPEESSSENQNLKIRDKIAEEYHVAPSTISADGQFAEALDLLEDQVRQDIRATVLQRQERGKQQATKKQVTQAGKALQHGTVTPMPFMRRDGWKSYQVLEAIEVLSAFPEDEHAALNTFLDRPFLPPVEGLKILSNLLAHDRDQRQRLYAMQSSDDPREQSLALTLAAKKQPEPDPQLLLAESLIKAADDMRQRQRRSWRRVFPHETWTADLDEIDRTLASLQDRWRTIAHHVAARHKERIAHYADILSTTE
jgi:hypothetical protein